MGFKKIGMGVVMVTFGFLAASCGTTSAEDLTVGDCFVMPVGSTFTSVEDQDCDEPHEAEVFARVTASSPLDDIESIDDAVATGDLFDDKSLELELLCFEKLSELADVDSLPEDAFISLVSVNEYSFSAQCIIASPSAGLVGSILG